MPLSRVLLLSLPLAMLVARPSEAQQIDPVVRQHDTLPTTRHEISRVGAVLGGIGGGVLGTVAGVAIGAASARGCRGEECGLGSALIGGVLGESIGLAAGSHLGSGSPRHDRFVTSALASTAIFVGGTAVSIALATVTGGASVIIVPVTPVFQLAAAWAIESR